MTKIKLQLFALMTIFSVSLFGQNNFTIKGEIELNEGNLLVLTERTTGIDTLASAPIKDGRFEINAMVNEPVMALLKLEKYDGGFLMVLEPNNDYTAVLRQNGLGDIHGGELQEVFNQYRTTVMEGNTKIGTIQQQLAEASKKKHFKTVNDLNKQIQEVLNDSRMKLDNLLVAHRGSVLGAYIQTSQLPQDASLENLKAVYNNLIDKAKETEPAKILASRIAKIEQTSVSAVAPNFTLPTPDGTEFSLYELKGKIKIVDFWASWCGPCRMENPNMVALYKDYKDKGLNILGVSLDQRKVAWLKAIEKDNLTWTQVSSLEGWKSEVLKLYNIDAVPTILVLDENNKIIGRNLRGEALRAFVAERLDK